MRALQIAVDFGNFELVGGSQHTDDGHRRTMSPGVGTRYSEPAQIPFARRGGQK